MDIVRLRDDVQCGMLSADVRRAFFFRVPALKYLMGAQIVRTNLTKQCLISWLGCFNALRL